MDYTLKTATKYATVALRVAVMAGLRKLGIHNPAVDEFDDQTVLRAFELTLPFEPVTIRQPTGWACQHMAIASSHGLGRPSAGCGCQMQPMVTTGH